MKPADVKTLHADPRYQKIAAAHAEYVARLADIQRQRDAADSALLEALGPYAGRLSIASVLSDDAVLNVLRPRGSKCRVAAAWPRSGVYYDAEIEQVTAARVRLVDYGVEFDLANGRERRSYERRSIHSDDLVKIKAGELTGWRQKPWGQP